MFKIIKMHAQAVLQLVPKFGEHNKVATVAAHACSLPCQLETIYRIPYRFTAPKHHQELLLTHVNNGINSLCYAGVRIRCW